ncbi:cytochrome C oxidase subunit IV family protein [Natronogracilivirga saccharolytica]|uniref:Cytochrome C oxidase subunit IV family protein n=1 Tax=Natronogracilivirga saccharolytica TaxID=2812953 RepID=A0A8J7RH29_9BACT|nr:cytochrome C oxidase subunit IV family protein [Natronogracilivirga saccharolytica]MBP3191077.1 cytochrome C oxidase subunit IV family protein [Natronogracilivirga saccharolytica]
MSTHHISTLATLMSVAAALLVLTFFTVAVTWFDIPAPFDVIAAMAIAIVKAALVAMFFMNLYWDTRFNSIVLLLSVLFLVIFISITLLDTLFRDAGLPIY